MDLKKSINCKPAGHLLKQTEEESLDAEQTDGEMRQCPRKAQVWKKQ